MVEHRIEMIEHSIEKLEDPELETEGIEMTAMTLDQSRLLKFIFLSRYHPGF